MTNRERIIKEYNELDRSYFMDEYKAESSFDIPFPIGYGQTISQPSLVLKMTLLLEASEDTKVLEIGTGSGYQTALLAKVSKKVYTVERIKELHLKAKQRLYKIGYSNIKFKLGDGTLGWEENSPYDRILVTASALKMPDKLIEQLAPNGRMVIPVGSGEIQDLMLVTKDLEGEVKEESLGKVKFVRLIGEY